MMNASSSSQIFRITILCIFSLIFIVVLTLSTPIQWHDNSIGDIVLKLMQLYIIFLFIRTFFYLGFSFTNFINSRDINPNHLYPLVSILIPSHNEEAVISQAIETTTKVKYPNFEIIVIDDGSTDKTLTKALVVAKKYSNVRIISKPNGGKADALNWGIREAYGEYILCMDADSILDPDVLLTSIPHIESDKNIAAVAGSVLIANSQENLVTRFQQLEYIIGLNFYKSAQSYLGIVNIIPGPIGIFRKSALIDVNGYATDTFAEDCDLTVRLLLKGYLVLYRPEMKARTEAPENTAALVTQRYRWNRGIIQAIIKNARWLIFPGSTFRSRFLILQMFLDSIFIPLFNFLFSMATIFFVLVNGSSGLIMFGPYFLALLTLDLVLTLFSIYTEGRFGHMLILTLFNRVTYGLSLEVIRFYALLDELLNVPMKWGVLKRKGIK